MIFISVTTSFAVAPPKLTIQLACFSDTKALPALKPLHPASSMSFPAEFPGGFSNILPALGYPPG